MKDFPGTPYDGMLYRNQIPMRIGTGIGYRLSPNIMFMLSYDLALDRYADQEGDLDSPRHNDIQGSNTDRGLYYGEEFDFQHQINLGVEYDINDKYSISTGAGYLHSAYRNSHQKDFVQWPDRYDLHLGTEINLSKDVQIGMAYCLYVSLLSESNFRMFKFDGNHKDEGITMEAPSIIKGEQSKYYRMAHIIALHITTKLL